MPDMEKVLKGLEYCLGANDCDVDPKEDCPYKGMCLCAMALRLDVVALLKEQEPVAPVLEQDSMVCGNCGHEVIWQKWLNGDVWLDEQLGYCPHCGKAVKWE